LEGQSLFIKMDVEGVENQVLVGAREKLPLAPRTVWLVEVNLDEYFPGGSNSRFSETLETLRRHGYEALIASPAERIVTANDVSRWTDNSRVDFGSHNCLVL
jgi:hypothetical protein